MPKLYHQVRQSEKDFMSFVVECATIGRWLTYHTFDSRHSVAGFPDLVMLRRDELVVSEIKALGGKLTLPQRAWLMAWLDAGARVFVWDPSCSAQVTRTLLPDNMQVIG